LFKRGTDREKEEEGGRRLEGGRKKLFSFRGDLRAVFLRQRRNFYFNSFPYSKLRTNL